MVLIALIHKVILTFQKSQIIKLQLKLSYFYILGEPKSHQRSTESSSSSAAQLPLIHQHLTASHWSAPSSNNTHAHAHNAPAQASNPAFHHIPPALPGAQQQHPSQQSPATAAALFANQPQMAALAAAAAAAGHYSLWPSYRAAAAAAAVAAIGES